MKKGEDPSSYMLLKKGKTDFTPSNDDSQISRITRADYFRLVRKQEESRINEVVSFRSSKSKNNV